MNETNRKQLHSTIIRLVNGEKIAYGKHELYFDENRLKTGLYPFMMRKLEEREPVRGFAAEVCTEALVSTLIAAADPIPWYEQKVFPVLCYVSNTNKNPNMTCPLKVIKDRCNVLARDSTNTIVEMAFIDREGDSWIYASPVKKEEVTDWLIEEKESL